MQIYPLPAYNLRIMTDGAASTSSPYRTLPALLGQVAPTTGTTPGTSATTTAGSDGLAGLAGGDFSRLLSALVLSMAMPGMSGQTSGTSGMGGDMMAPLLLTLLEKLLASQVTQTSAAPTPIKTVDPTAVVQRPTGDGVHAKPSGMPVKAVLTQGSHPGHVAIDLGISVGTSIKSTMDGKVIYAGWNNEGYGNLVIVQNGAYKTYYAHLSKVPVRVGDKVEKGDVIGISGNTGNSTGPHLHYEVRVNNQQVDPRRFTRDQE